MNDLALRIRPTGGGRSRVSIGIAPITFPRSIFRDSVSDERYPQIHRFINSDSTDEQITVLRSIFQTDLILIINDEVVLKFLVVTFWRAEAKHPIKCFITKNVTRMADLQQPFAEALATHMIQEIATMQDALEYTSYNNIVNATVCCLENFPPGVAAVKLIQLTLAQYLKNCLQCSVRTLREKSLSPTSKSDMFNLIHKSVRILYHILQNAGDEIDSELTHIYIALKLYIQDLMFDGDVPMDTKSLCGLLYLTVYCLEYGADSWIDVLNPDAAQGGLLNLMSVDSARLSLLSALINTVDVQELSDVLLEDTPAILVLTQEILTLGEKNFCESVLFLGVARTLLVISKVLDQIPERGTGVVIMDQLLKFSWSHLDHHMDSVRHQVGQMVGFVVNYAAWLEGREDRTAIHKILTGLSQLDISHKSYHVYLTCLATALPPMRLLGGTVRLKELLASLKHQQVQSTASTSLSILLEKFSLETSASHVNNDWIRPIIEYVEHEQLDVGALNIIETLLAKALHAHPRLDEYIMSYIGTLSRNSVNLKIVLVLLRVARKAGILDRPSEEHSWKGIFRYCRLRRAVMDSTDEIRILALSVVVESNKSTEMFSKQDIEIVLCFLKYNINAQSPNFRQMMLANLTKFTKRLNDSYRVLQRTYLGDKILQFSYYWSLTDKIREFCFDCLLPGANYGRRNVALNVLAACTKIYYQVWRPKWEVEYVEKLLLHLEDSFEVNKELALKVLTACPMYLIEGREFVTSIKLEDIFRQASSINPTDCTSAAYKLEFVMTRLPDEILVDASYRSGTDPVRFALVWQLLSAVKSELAICRESVVRAAGHAPMYGLLHCIKHVLVDILKGSIASSPEWTQLIGDLISTCFEVNSAVGCVVNNSSPEGHLPCDMSLQLTDHGNSANITLEDGRQVTAQMVLLCAWRCVKEVSLILGCIGENCYITGENRQETCTLSVEQVVAIGQHFTSLLAETKHRGAFEQAYLGFTKLLARLWRCRSELLHSLPVQWVSELMSVIKSADTHGTLCATRRSAGLPFMIQALVSTELQGRKNDNPECFHTCMQTLLSLCEHESEETRTHALNILRALFRAHALDHSVMTYVGQGLLTALRGFDRDSWAEINSSTLLFSALMTRIFGVVRTRDADELCARNKMTGRIFFLRYPHLYDFMLDKLREATETDDAQVLRPSLYPILLLLSRLYPSSLEGTVSNLTLVSFIPHVLSCARSSVLHTRYLAARAIVPLIEPHSYLRQIQSIFGLLLDVHIKRNHCHGLLLILSRLLLQAPPEVKLCGHVLNLCVDDTLWILEQATGDKPCYMIAFQYFEVLQPILSAGVSLSQKTLTTIKTSIENIVFSSDLPEVCPGREICMSESCNIYFRITTPANITAFIYKALDHPTYDLTLQVLEYIRSLHTDTNTTSKTVLENLRKDERYYLLLQKLTNNNQIQVKQQALTLLNMDSVAYKYILDPNLTVKGVIEKLTEYIENSTDLFNYIYLEILANFVTKKILEGSFSGEVWLMHIRVMFESCRSDNHQDMREVVTKYIARNLRKLLTPEYADMSPAQRFEYICTLWVIIIILLEDQEEAIRARVCNVVHPIVGSEQRVLSGRCSELVRKYVSVQGGREGAAVLAVMAMLHFKSVVVITDEANDECRVFDQNERHNVFLEETVLTKDCADIIRNDFQLNHEDLRDIINDKKYKTAFENLCGENAEVFKKMVAGEEVKKEAVNPKLVVLFDKLYVPMAGGNAKVSTKSHQVGVVLLEPLWVSVLATALKLFKRKFL